MLSTSQTVRVLVIAWGACVTGLGAEPAATKLLRFPDIHNDKLVFTYAGDLWLAPAAGGTATRLTAHPGLELFAHFSPDGQQIAFTGQYDGDEQVYVIPASGGVPRQLTWYPARGPLPDRWGYDNQVYGWTPDGSSVLFRSLRSGWSLTDCRLFTVALSGGLPVPLPMTVSGAGDFSPDGKRVVFSPLFRDFRTWKRYEGGWAQDLFLFDLSSHQYEQITNHPRSDRDPMWVGDRIYFASDRDGTLNLYFYDLATKRTEQVTHSTKFDVRWPSRGNNGQIVYELGGELQVLDTSTGQSQAVSIFVPNDGLAMRPKRIPVSQYIEDFDLGPQGKRAAIVARGDVFTVPLEKGPTRNLTHSSGAHDKWATWSPDGTMIAYISDSDGEEELYVVDSKGESPPRQVTDGGTAMRYAPQWSPDGKRLALSDKDGRLMVVVAETGQQLQLADEARGQVHDYNWSPCSSHLAFSLSDENGFRSLYIWSVEDGQTRRVTGPEFNEESPVWDPEGKYLYYLSDREYAPEIGSAEWDYILKRTTGVFALALRKDVPHPVPPESDEVESPAKAAASEAKPAAGSGPAAGGAVATPAEPAPAAPMAPIKIDFDGLAQRVARLPIEDDSYSGLAAVKGHLLLLRSGSFYYGRAPDTKSAVLIYTFKDRKTTMLAEGVAGFSVSPDGSKVLVREGNTLQVFDATPEGKNNRKTMSTDGLLADVVPKEEWVQIFNEIWRRYRDFFYVENMHGYDWQALREQYRPLLDHVAHRSDLNYVIGEMIAELNVGHAYNTGGDYDVPDRPKVALPGAVFQLDAAAGRYRLARILRGQNEEPNYRAPLTEIGVNVSDGDFVLAIDHQELGPNDNPYRLLRNKADRPVTLKVNARPTMDGARDITFRPVTSEEDLMYLDWVSANRAKVAAMTGGRVGYIHLPNMQADGLREFIKSFYSQLRRDGLIIDVRNNGGGNVSQMVINRLARKLLATGFARTFDTPTTYPRTVFHGHLVCLLDETSASDGDIFPAMFRQAGLGPLIGKRSWGGVTGITNRGTLIDGGTVNVPEYGFASADGKWIIEGRGVSPDIEVENDPRSLIEGRDLQLERAVKEISERIQREPQRLPQRPAAPVKTK